MEEGYIVGCIFQAVMGRVGQVDPLGRGKLRPCWSVISFYFLENINGLTWEMFKKQIVRNCGQIILFSIKVVARSHRTKFTYKFNPVKQISNRAAAIAQWFNLPLPPVAAGSNPKHTIYTVFQFALLNL